MNKYSVSNCNALIGEYWNGVPDSTYDIHLIFTTWDVDVKRNQSLFPNQEELPEHQ